jgi:purine-binding chemotaxis protein CheW
MSDAVWGESDAMQAVLESRARALAVPVGAHATGDALEVVCVQIAKQRYALEAAEVREVFRLADLAQLPGAQPPVFGVTVWRGDLLLLLDLRRALGLSSTALNDLRHVVVLAGKTASVAILVDEIEGMQIIRATDVRPTTGSTSAVREFVRGVTSDALIVLDTKALLRVLDSGE